MSCHFTSLRGNGPSRLLQAVKNALLETYPKTDISGDGQIVSLDFSDGIKFEVLPAFQDTARDLLGILTCDETYKYPDTHMGGHWIATNPKAEQKAMKDKNDSSNGLLFDTCKHIRYIRDNNYSSYHLSGILIDAFVYDAIGSWHWGEKIIQKNITYEQSLFNYYLQLGNCPIFPPMLAAPGSGVKVDCSRGWDVLGKILNTMA